MNTVGGGSGECFCFCRHIYVNTKSSILLRRFWAFPETVSRISTFYLSPPWIFFFIFHLANPNFFLLKFWYTPRGIPTIFYSLLQNWNFHWYPQQGEEGYNIFYMMNNILSSKFLYSWFDVTDTMFRYFVGDAFISEILISQKWNWKTINLT